jgi:hypothetical protein
MLPKLREMKQNFADVVKLCSDHLSFFFFESSETLMRMIILSALRYTFSKEFLIGCVKISQGLPQITLQQKIGQETETAIFCKG